MALWLVRAGSYGEQEQRCLDNGFVTIGWSDLPDLSIIDSREKLKNLYREFYDGEKEAAINNRIGQIWTFLKKISVGDLVALPLKSSPLIAFGKVTGSYEFKNDQGEDIKHTLSVDWIDKEVPRTRFDQNILYSFGAFMTVCQIKRDKAEEKVQKVLQGRNYKNNIIESADTSEDPIDDTSTVIDISELARNQITEHINNIFKGHKLEVLVEAILQTQGYVTDRTVVGTDGGADILAGKGSLGLESPRILVEVKSEDTPISLDVIDRARGAVEKFGAEQGLVVSLNGFKNGVKKKCRDSYFKIRLWDQDDLLNALFKAYDRMPEQIQSELPLKKTWTLVLKGD